jgi:hypothetical protein
MKKFRKAQILIFMMIVLATLLIAISAMLHYVRAVSNFYARQIDFSKGLYCAESGVQRSIYLVKEKGTYLTGVAPWTDTITVNSIPVNITIDETAQENIYSVVSEAQIGVTKPTVTAQVKYRQYSQVETEIVDEEERLMFVRYKSAKILTIDY